MERVTSRGLRPRMMAGSTPERSYKALAATVFGLLIAAAMPQTTLAQPELVYSNPEANLLLPPGAGRRIADDIFLDSQCQCELVTYDLLVSGGGNGSGEGFTVEYAMYDDCPSRDGSIIPGTEGIAVFDDDGDHVIVHEVPADTLALIGSPVWLAVEFSRAGAGWYCGTIPEIGFSADLYDFPGFDCEANLGAQLYAGFQARLFCLPEQGAPVENPEPADGSGVVSDLDDMVLRWNELGHEQGQGSTSSVMVDPTTFITAETFEDGTVHPDESFAIWQAAIDNGEIPDPTTLDLPEPAPIEWPNQIAGVQVPDVTPEDLFWYEDSNDILATGFTQGQLNFLMGQAANAVIAEHGDNFDFIAFWMNFNPIDQFGAAFYQPLVNDVSGIGLGQFNQRANFGVIGQNVQGFVMMYNQANWGVNSAFTQLVLGQEFEHRFALFLSPLPGDRPLQGNNSVCGRSAHWNFRVDGQGSGMEIAEWVGSNPANRVGGTLNYNTDIPGSVFSYPDLYLMGYVSGLEMDANSSQLRYMNGSNCGSSHTGTISTWDSGDLVSVHGVRSPSSFFAQKHFRTAWVMLHRPNQEPTPQQLSRTASILNNWNQKYIDSVLGRGTMSNVLTPPVIADPCDTVYDVRLDTVSPPETVVCEDEIQPQCDPGDLEENETYFWQVSASRQDVDTVGPIWTFNTFCTLTNQQTEVCTIDGRQPHTVNNPQAREGLQSVSFGVDCTNATVVVEDFEVTSSSPDIPAITGIFESPGQVTVDLSEPVPSGAWTCVTYLPNETSICLGSLPGDVDGSGLVNGEDIRGLVLTLDGSATFPEVTTDINRDGVQGPEDVLRLLDVMNGGSTFESWYGESIGVCPAAP